MVTKKGIALTAAIIGGFTAASFLVYFVPTSPANEVMVTYTDPATELAFARERGEAILNEFDLTFEMWKSNELERGEFDERAGPALEQIDSLIQELHKSKPPEAWVQSYFLYIQALESYRSYFEQAGEYVAYASQADADPERVEELRDSISESLAKADDLLRQSEDAVP